MNYFDKIISLITLGLFFIVILFGLFLNKSKQCDTVEGKVIEVYTLDVNCSEGYCDDHYYDYLVEYPDGSRKIYEKKHKIYVKGDIYVDHNYNCDYNFKYLF